MIKLPFLHNWFFGDNSQSKKTSVSTSEMIKKIIKGKMKENNSKIWVKKDSKIKLLLFPEIEIDKLLFENWKRNNPEKNA
jgi:hypothetical protein